MLQWNDDLTPKQSDGRWDFIRKLLTVRHFSQTFQTIISVLSLLTDLAYARDDFANTIDDNILHKTWLAFCWLTSTTWLLKFLQLFMSHIWMMSQKESSFFFFALLIGHKKWIKLGSTLVKTRKCANHEQFRHTTKILSYDNFTSSSNVICSAHALTSQTPEQIQ